MIRMHPAQTIWNFLMVSAAVIGFLILIIYMIPHQVMKAWVDYLAPDGSLESFTPGMYAAFKRIFFPLGIVSFLVAAWLFRSRHGANRILSNLFVSYNKFAASRAAEIRHLSGALLGLLEDSRYAIALLVITGLGILNRAILLSKQVSHDEAYTFMAFVSMGLRQVLTDYHLPNNHIFHSLLVLFSSELFGIQPWAIRMPAFAAGVLLIPATYLVARIFYDKQTALISAGWVASIPALIGYSTNARGYSIVSLFTLLLIALGAYLKEKKSLVGWSAFILLAAFGFYTIPIMLYPFGLVITWMFLTALFKQVGPEYGENPFLGMVIKYLVPVCFAVILLVLLLYLPVFINSGIQSVIGNGFVASLEWSEFLESIQVRITNTWKEWNAGLSPAGSTLLVIGIGASIFAALTRKQPRVPLAVAAIIWIGSALVIQRVAPWPRVWIFLLPLVLISAASGLMAAARFAGSRLPAGSLLSAVVFATCLLVPLIASAMVTVTVYANSRGERGNVEEVAFFLKDYLGPQDVIIVTSPDAVTVRYYLKQYGIDGDQTFYRGDKEYSRALVIVNQRYNQTLDSVLNNRSVTARIETGTERIVYQRGKTLVYELDLPPDAGD